ncbi:MAG: UbiD family decarboxylase [Phycisphaerales bacterium]|nr:UbiD family decarboxylase [Phycisphaerales bacterium]
MYPTTRDYLNALSAAGELRRITETVSPVLSITALADRESKSAAPKLPSAATRAADPRFHQLGGSALLIENVQGADWPVLINQFGSYHRMEMALGCHDDGGHTPGGLEALAKIIGELTKPEPPRSFGEVLAKAKQFLPLLRIPPRRKRGSGLCQEVVIPQEKVDLRRLPIIRCWPMDGDFAALGYPAGVNDDVPGLGRGAEWERTHRGRYITLAGIHTVHADDRDNPKPPSHNIGMYRVQLLGEKTLAMHWHMHHDGARHWRSWKKLGKPMPVAIALGGESVMPYAATAPLPPGISELLLAGFLNKGGIPMVRGKTVPLWVPANAEIVIEGYVSNEAGFIDYDPRDPKAGPIGPGAVFEGPFGDHTGFYSLPDRYPLLTVTAITHRRDPIYPTTVVGLPPQEDYFLGKATERLFLPLLKTIVHDIADYDLPMYGAFHNAAHIKIKKEYPLQGRRVMHSIWGAGQMAWTKTICVVDQDVDVHDATAVLRAVGEHCHPARDVAIVEGPLDILDHAAPYLGAGGKIGFDTTPKRDAERMAGPDVGMVARVADGERVIAAVRKIEGVLGATCPSELGSRWLLVSVDKSLESAERGAGADVDRIADEARTAIASAGGGVRYAIIVGAGVDLAGIDEALFHWCANFDPRRDTMLEGELMIFDATPKSPLESRHGLPTRAYPPILTLDGNRTGGTPVPPKVR